MLRKHDKSAFDEALKKVYFGKGHKALESDLEVRREVIDRLVSMGILAFENESTCIFHDRLTLRAMEEEMKTISKKGFGFFKGN
jgi:hypothetical protein